MQNQKATIVTDPEPNQPETKNWNGIPLVWEPDFNRYMLPLPEPEKAKKKILFDETTGTFIQIMIDNPLFYYRDRTATAPDGTVLNERVFIGKDRKGDVIEIGDPYFQRALIENKKLMIMKHAVDLSGAMVGVFAIGVIVAMIAFFWNLVKSAGIMAEAFAAGSVASMMVVGSYAAWIIGLVIAGFLLKYSIPMLFRRNPSTDSDSSGESWFGSGSGSDGDDEKTTIIVQNIRGSDNTNGAQNYVNGRKI